MPDVADKPAFDDSKPFTAGAAAAPVASAKPAFDDSKPFTAGDASQTPGGIIQGLKDSNNSLTSSGKTQQSIAGGLLPVVQAVGRGVDYATGAPVRAAIGQMQQGNFSGAPGAFIKQYGKAPETAPTEQEISKNTIDSLADVTGLDFNKRISQVHIAGTNKTVGQAMNVPGLLDLNLGSPIKGAIGFGANLTNYIPGEAMAAAGGKAISAASGAARYAGETASGLIGGAGEGVAKLVSEFNGMPKSDVLTYIRSKPEVMDVIKNSANDTEAADFVKQHINGSIQQTRQALGKTIGDTLESLPPEAKTDISPVLQKLEDAKAKFDPRFEANAPVIEAIDNKISELSKFADENGQVHLGDMHKIKQDLQDAASAAYKPGSIFPNPDKVANSMKGAASEARLAINDALPEVAEANNKLSELHDIQDNMNKSLLAEGKPATALISAGRGGSATAEKAAQDLQKIGLLTGTDAEKQAKLLSASQTFRSPSWTPHSFTGRSLLGAATGGAVGGATGGEHGAAAGALAGAFLSSPIALKAAIDAGLLAKPMVDKLLSIAPEAIESVGNLGTKALKIPGARSGLLYEGQKKEAELRSDH